MTQFFFGFIFSIRSDDILRLDTERKWNLFDARKPKPTTMVNSTQPAILLACTIYCTYCFKSPVHHPDFLSCEFRLTAQVFQGDGHGFRYTRGFQLIHHLLDRAFRRCGHFAIGALDEFVHSTHWDESAKVSLVAFIFYLAYLPQCTLESTTFNLFSLLLNYIFVNLAITVIYEFVHEICLFVVYYFAAVNFIYTYITYT